MFNTSIAHVTYYINTEGRIVKLLLLIAIEAIALLGNIFFIVAVFNRKPITKQTRTFIYLGFVSLTNLGAAIFVIPFPIITMAMKKWALSPGMCYVNGWMTSFWLTSNVYSLTVLSVHKYLSIVRPMHQKGATYKAVAYRIAITILIAMVVTTIPYIKNFVYFNPYTAQCAINIDQVGYLVYIVLSIYFIPTVINILVYMRIVISLKKHSRRLRFTTFYNPRLLDNQKRMMKTLYMAFFTFLFSWTPFFIYAILYFIDPKSTSPKYFLVIAYIAGYSNSALNPLIFIFRNLQVRGRWSSVLKHKHLPKLALVPSMSRSVIPLDDRRSSYFCNIPNDFVKEEILVNGYHKHPNEYFTEQAIIESSEIVLTSYLNSEHGKTNILAITKSRTNEFIDDISNSNHSQKQIGELGITNSSYTPEQDEYFTEQTVATSINNNTHTFSAQREDDEIEIKFQSALELSYTNKNTELKL